MADREFDVQGFARGIHELLVLSTLQQAPKHGYQIALDVEADSDGLFCFRHGTLYPILHRLEKEGVIRGRWSRSGGRRKKRYELTRSGRRYLNGETSRVHEIVGRLLNLLPPLGEGLT